MLLESFTQLFVMLYFFICVLGMHSGHHSLSSFLGWGHGSVIDHVLGMQKVTGSVPGISG